MFENAHFINIGFDPSTPYDDLPLLPPSAELESKKVLKLCIQARAQIAELQQVCRGFTYPALLWKFFPLIEAQASAAMRGKTCSLDKLLKLPDNELPEDPLVAHVQSLRSALELGLGLISERSLDLSMLQELSSHTERGPMPLRRTRATGHHDPVTNELVYTPPIGSERLQRLMVNWEQFVHVDAGNLDPLVLLAVAHYQLQAIQPFSDHNGDVARMTDYLLLAEEGLLTYPVLGLSSWFYQNRVDYHRLQLAVTQDQRWEDWLVFILKGVISRAQTVLAGLRATEDLIVHTHDHIKAKLPKMYSEQLLEVIFCEPCARIQDLVSRDIAKRQTASVYLKKLCEIGVLTEVPFGKEKLFVHNRLIKLMQTESGQFSRYGR